MTSMSSGGAETTLVRRHPDRATPRLSPHSADGVASPQVPSASSRVASRPRRTSSNASSASQSGSQGESLPAGGLNSAARAAVRLSQLERLKAARQSAQATRTAGPSTPGTFAPARQASTASTQTQRARLPANAEGSASAERAGCQLSTAGSSMSGMSSLSRGGVRDRQRGASKGYLERYIAAGKSLASPPQAQEQKPRRLLRQLHAQSGDMGSAGAEYSTRSSGDGVQEADIVSPPSVHGAAQQTADGSEGVMQPLSATSGASAASQGAGAGPSRATADSEAQEAPPSSDLHDPPQHEPACTGVGAVAVAAHKARGCADAEAQSKGPPSSTTQAPGKAKPLPQADAPVCSPKTQAPEATPARRCSPGRATTPPPTHSGAPRGSPGVLFVQPSLGMAGVLGTDKGAAKNAPQHVSLHAFAARKPGETGNASAEASSSTSAPHAQRASKEGLSMASGKGVGQRSGVQKDRLAEVAESGRQRPKGLAALLAGLCSCFAPQSHSSPSEPVAMCLSVVSGLPGNGEGGSAALPGGAANTNEEGWSIDTEPVLEPRMGMPAGAVLGPASGLEKQESFLAALEKQGGCAGGPEEQQMAAAPQAERKLVPFVSSAVSLFEGAPSSGAAQMPVPARMPDLAPHVAQATADKDSCPFPSDRAEPMTSTRLDGEATEGLQRGSTLQSQTSLAALQSQSSEQIASAVHDSHKAHEGDANKWFLPGPGVGKDLRAFLTRQHPGMPAALLDPKLPTPWRSSPSRIQKPSPAHGSRAHASPSIKHASPQRPRSSPKREGSPLHVPAYQREGSPAQLALARIKRSPKKVSFTQTQAWSPAKTNIVLVREVAKSPSTAAIRICTAAPNQRSAGQVPEQATPAGKRAVRATINQLQEVSQANAGPPKKGPQSIANVPAASSQAAPVSQARERSGRGLQGKLSSMQPAPAARNRARSEQSPVRKIPSPACPARPERHVSGGAGSQSSGLPQLRAAMMGPGGVRTNALLESGTSAHSMQASRVAMRSIGEAQQQASRGRSRNAAPTHGLAGDKPRGATALERQVLQQYLSARQMRERAAAAQRGPSSGASQGPHRAEGSTAGARSGLSDSLEAELADLERHWEDLERASAHDSAQPAQGGDEEDKQALASKRVASVIERWESRNISAEALQSMRESTDRRSWSGDGSASAAGAPSSSVASMPKMSSKKASDDSLTHATLDMLEQLSSPAERSAGLGLLPALGPSSGQPGHSSKVSTDMESICEAKTLPGSLSPLSSAPSPLSLSGAAGRSAEKLPFASDSSLMAAVAAAASPASAPPPAATLSARLRPQKLADAFNSVSMPGNGTDGSEQSLIGAHLG